MSRLLRAPTSRLGRFLLSGSATALIPGTTFVYTTTNGEEFDLTCHGIFRKDSNHVRFGRTCFGDLRSFTYPMSSFKVTSFDSIDYAEASAVASAFGEELKNDPGIS